MTAVSWRVSTRYSVIASPPVVAGAVHVTVAESSRAVALTSVGDAGSGSGITVADVSDVVLGPRTLWATTRNRYAVPLVSPVTVHVSDVGDERVNVQVQRCAPVWLVAVYEVTGDPPLAEACQSTFASSFPGVAVTVVGATGTVEGTRVEEAVVAGPVPRGLTAATVTV